MTTAVPRTRAGGFTLLELLVALTLLGLLLAALFGGLRLGARAWDVGESRLEQSERLQIGQEFLRARIEGALPVDVPDERGRARLVFRGENSRVSFVTTLPAQLGPALHVLTVGARRDGNGALHLALAWRPLGPERDRRTAGGDEAGRRDLVRGVAAVELGYFGSHSFDEPARWHEEWIGANALPRLVRVRVTFAPGDSRHWPDLLARPMIDYVYSARF